MWTLLLLTAASGATFDPDTQSPLPEQDDLDAHSSVQLLQIGNELQHSSSQPISSFCLGEIDMMGTKLSGKGAHVIDSGSVSEWAGKDGGIQPEDIAGFIEDQEPLIFLTAGVTGTLELADATRTKLLDTGYELIDIAGGNADGISIGKKQFSGDCPAGNLDDSNLSPMASGAFTHILGKVKQRNMVAVLALTGDAMILLNKLHKKHGDFEFTGLISTM